MKRAAASVSAVALVAVLCVMHVSCNDPPAADGSGTGAATTACAPLDDPAASLTAEGLTADGHYVVVVTRAGTSRVFFGVSSHVVEGVLTGLHQSCALEVDFDVQGRAEVATFSPGPPACDVASTLTSGNPGDAIAKVTLDVVVPAAATANDGGADGGADADDGGGGGGASNPAAMPTSSLLFFCL